jgi:hypothetical protein
MGDGTDDVLSVDPRAFIWWRGLRLCRRPTPDPPRTKRLGRHLRSGVYLTDAQLEVYQALRHKKVPVAKALRMARESAPGP